MLKKHPMTHKMYDPEIVTELLRRVVFANVRTTYMQAAHLCDFLHHDRVPKLALVIAIK